MATPRITYNSIDIDLTMGRKGLYTTHEQAGSENVASSGIIETINFFGLLKIEVDLYFSTEQYYDLLAWWSWARHGLEFSFTADNALTGDTTLDDAASSAQKVIPVTSTTDFNVGDYCLLKNDNDTDFEVVKIDSISTDISITTVENLKASYVSGDTLRHVEYFPRLLKNNKKFVPKRTGAIDKSAYGYYKHTFKFKEAI